MTVETLHPGPRVVIRAYPDHELITWRETETQVLHVYRGDQAARIIDSYDALLRKCTSDVALVDHFLYDCSPWRAKA